MKFELNPTMVLTKEEFATLDNALKLCRDMDVATSFNDEDFEAGEPSGCDICPKRWTCSKMAHDCVFTIAHKTLKEIMDMSVVK